MGKSSQLPCCCRHWMVKEGFRPGGQRAIAIPLLLRSASPSGSIGSMSAYLQVLGAADVDVVCGAHLHVAGAGEVANGLGSGESLPAHPGRGSCGEGRASSELIWDSEMGYQHSCPPRQDPCDVARVPVRDFLFLILIVLLLNSLELRTSFLWDGEHENPRASPGEVMHIN